MRERPATLAQLSIEPAKGRKVDDDSGRKGASAHVRPLPRRHLLARLRRRYLHFVFIVVIDLLIPLTSEQCWGSDKLADFVFFDGYQDLDDAISDPWLNGPTERIRLPSRLFFTEQFKH